jgi:hypothetical protein
VTGNRSGRLPWYRWPWPKVRLQILERDNYTCQIGGRWCTRQATQVDHIVPPPQGGAWFDPSNLRASCRKCNMGRIYQGPSQAWRDAATRITLVHGPPCGGKTTYVRTHAGPDDLIIDYDLLAQAMGSTVTHGHGNHEAVAAARNALISKLRSGKVTAPRAWLVSANPRAVELYPHHDVVLCDPGIDEAQRRAIEAGRPSSWSASITEWYQHSAIESSLPPSRAW